MKVQTYNLDSFKESLSWSLDSIPLTMNRRLAKALDYLNHGLFLSNIRSGVGFGNPTAQSYLAADIFSNFYKAASVIVGDPSKDSDFQSRYKKIGLSREFWKEKIEHIRKLRNDYGVAHHDLDGKQLQGEVEMAAQVAKTVIDHYIKSLRQNEAATD